jgi:hypothetical protein
MSRWTPDPTFYPSPREAATVPAETLAYVAAFDRSATRPDAIAVVDTHESSASYGQVVRWTDLPNVGDGLHHFGWNACSSALCPTAPHPHVERRYLVVPGLRSSRPDGIYVSALGGADGRDGLGGIAVLDHTSFKVRGAWEAEQGPQFLAYDVWWHLNQDVLVTSEWGTPSMIEHGIVGELLLHGQGAEWAVTKVIDIPGRTRRPGRPARSAQAVRGGATAGNRHRPVRRRPPVRLLMGHRRTQAVRRQRPVSPRTDRLGADSCGSSAVPRIPPIRTEALAGGPQMVEVSRDGRRGYVTNSLYGAWGDQFYPDGVGAWQAKLDTGGDSGLSFDTRLFPHGDDIRGPRVHQTRLQGGDASSDSYCFP